jgi:hypothetical protein
MTLGIEPVEAISMILMAFAAGLGVGLVAQMIGVR